MDINFPPCLENIPAKNHPYYKRQFMKSLALREIAYDRYNCAMNNPNQFTVERAARVISQYSKQGSFYDGIFIKFCNEKNYYSAWMYYVINHPEVS
jgi:hypothetical protein